MEDSNNESGKYKPRFDFNKDHNNNPSETGTINELLQELNYEMARTENGKEAGHSNASGKTITHKELKGVIDLVSSTP